MSHPRSVSLPAFAVALVLGAGIGLPACKSEIDGKPKAAVSDVKKKSKDQEAKDKKAGHDKSQDKADEAKKADKPATAGPVKSFRLDGSKSKIGFVGAKVTGDHRGHFGELTGKLEAAGGEPAKLEIEVKTASVEADHEKLTGHLKSPDFFDVEKFPTAKFVAKTFAKEAKDGATHKVTGELELHGVKKEVSFPATIEASDAGAKGKAAFTINRKDFGIEYPGKPDDLIKDDVLLELELVFG
ncbi:MAG: YceI family protein [Myxococcales bacterium FL481]|nr:MAG: YceI family protein [Myxococcales bacterium FL481]